MTRIAVDFGTGNTVISYFNETRQQTQVLAIPNITTTMKYRLDGDRQEREVAVIPSLIYYGEKETLIGDQVLSRGLAEHPDTFRWMKRSIAHNVTKRKKTSQGHKSPIEAGTDFMKLVLGYASDQMSFDNDEFTFTAPTEAFEDFQDWIRRVCEEMGIRRLRMMDEPTACVLGYHGACRSDEHFLVVDFGCGTLDISAVRIDLAAQEDRKARQLGQAGHDLGGMNIDLWLAEDFCNRHNLSEADRKELEAVILRQAEQTKIALSDTTVDEADMTVIHTFSGRPRVLKTTYTRDCKECLRSKVGKHEDPGQSCLGCLLAANQFQELTRQTIDRALENATSRAGLRRDQIVKVLVTGGTSLVPCVQKMLHNSFGQRVECQNPFEAVSRGGCRGIVVPILQHDYAIESYNPQKKEYEFKPLFNAGLDYPTSKPYKLWAKGSYDGMTRIGLKIFELSRVKKRQLHVSLVDDRGVIQDAASKVEYDYDHICLNPDNPTFIVANPPINRQRDEKRFLCSFHIDPHRRLLVTVLDNHKGKPILENHPVVRL